MVTILTKTECIQFNLKDVIREKALVNTVKYHKDNPSDKKIKITSPEFEGGERIIIPSNVENIYYENRIYYPKVGFEIEQLLKIFNIKP